MESTGESTIQINLKRRILVGQIVLPLFMGLLVFWNVTGDPRFQNIRNLDVVRLIAIGACWGVAAAGLAMLIRSKFPKT
jgi:hypothetical protein